MFGFEVVGFGLATCARCYLLRHLQVVRNPLDPSVVNIGPQEVACLGRSKRPKGIAAATTTLVFYRSLELTQIARGGIACMPATVRVGVRVKARVKLPVLHAGLRSAEMM